MNRNTEETSKTIISIDQSGKGTTGFLVVRGHGEPNPLMFFDEFPNKDYEGDKKNVGWEEHLDWITESILRIRPDVVLFENTTFLYGRQHQGTTNLYKLTGGIVAIGKTISQINKVYDHYLKKEKAVDFGALEFETGNIAVNSVKAFRDKISKGENLIEGLSYEAGRGKGWIFKYQTNSQAHHSGNDEGWKRVSLHMVDALVIYHLWTKENLPTCEDTKKEIAELESNSRLGKNQKERLEKLKRLWQ